MLYPVPPRRPPAPTCVRTLLNGNKTKLNRPAASSVFGNTMATLVWGGESWGGGGGLAQGLGGWLC